jgi:hypothetical protein
LATAPDDAADLKSQIRQTLAVVAPRLHRLRLRVDGDELAFAHYAFGPSNALAIQLGRRVSVYQADAMEAAAHEFEIDGQLVGLNAEGDALFTRGGANGRRNTLVRYDVQTGQADKRPLELGAAIRRLDFDPWSRYAVAVHNPGNAKSDESAPLQADIWRLTPPQHVARLEIEPYLGCLLFDAAGTRLYLGSTQALHRYRLADGAPLGEAIDTGNSATAYYPTPAPSLVVRSLHRLTEPGNLAGGFQPH